MGLGAGCDGGVGWGRGEGGVIMKTLILIWGHIIVSTTY